MVVFRPFGSQMFKEICISSLADHRDNGTEITDTTNDKEHTSRKNSIEKSNRLIQPSTTKTQQSLKNRTIKFPQLPQNNTQMSTSQQKLQNTHRNRK